MARGSEVPVKAIRRITSSALVWSYATTVLRFGGLLLVLPIVLRSVPNDELGLFYFFQTLSVLVTLIDAGVGPTVYRSVNYALAGARELQRKGYELAPVESNNTPNLPLLGQLVGTYSRFYQIGALALLAVFVLGCSPFVWKITEELQNPSTGRAVWMFLAVAGAINFAGALWGSMLLGLNRVREHQGVQFVTIACGYLVTAGGLLAGWGLWALAASTAIQAFLGRELARRICHRTLTDLGADLKALRFDRELFTTLWPSAWRTGLVTAGVSAYLSIPVFFTSNFSSLDEAGSIGLAMQLAVTVGQVASVVFVVKGPMFAIFRVSGEVGKLRTLFFTRLAIMVSLLAAGSIAVLVLGDWAIHDVIGSKTPLPDFTAFLLILLFAGMDNIQSTFRGLAISANQISFWKIICFGAIAVGAISFFGLGGGVTLFLAVLVVGKFLMIDIPIIKFGLLTLKS